MAFTNNEQNSEQKRLYLNSDYINLTRLIYLCTYVKVIVQYCINEKGVSDLWYPFSLDNSRSLNISIINNQVSIIINLIINKYY